MHSFGESNMQPSTPCSASGECGGNRSRVGRASPRAAFCRRVFFKSAVAPAVSETESIMQREDCAMNREASKSYRHQFPFYSRSYSLENNWPEKLTGF